jgi:hypothetical protein
MPPFAILAQTAAQLAAATTPTSGTDLEAVPWDMFDTNLTTFATGAGPLNVAFYQTVQTDPTLGNMQMPGALPAPQWLEPAAIACDILSVPSSSVATTATGALSDTANILKTNTAAFNMKVSQKDYGTFPLMLAHGVGGEMGYGWGAEVSNFEYANNGPADGGWWTDGSIIIPSQQNFIVSIITQQGKTLTLNATTPIRMNMWGVLHRRVL